MPVIEKTWNTQGNYWDSGKNKLFINVATKAKFDINKSSNQRTADGAFLYIDCIWNGDKIKVLS